MNIGVIKHRLPGGAAFNNLKKKIEKNRQWKALMQLDETDGYRPFLMRPNMKAAWLAYFFGDRIVGGTKREIKYTIANARKVIQSGKEWINIKQLRLPIPDELNAAVSFCFEFSDLVLPYLFPQDHTGKYEKIENMFIEGPYELGNVQIEAGDVVLDCGANMGLFSAVAASKGGGTVYAFEPSKFVIEEYLQKTANWNKGISIENTALSDYIGKAEFSFSQDFVGEGKIGKLTEKSRSSVDVTTIDQFVKDRQLQKVDFIKADIEGEERHMLLGAGETLRTFAPKLSICTYHLPDDPEVLKKIILDANPAYVIEEQYMKLYAYVPRV